jgi:hypothetical protein
VDLQNFSDFFSRFGVDVDLLLDRLGHVLVDPQSSGITIHPKIRGPWFWILDFAQFRPGGKV